MRTCKSSYLSCILDPDILPITVAEVVKILRNEVGLNKFDSIVFRGMSGAMIGPMVANAVHKGMILIRKKGDSSHSSYVVEGDVNSKRVVILDDLIHTGETIANIAEQLKEFITPRPAISAIVLYKTLDSDSRCYIEPKLNCLGYPCVPPIYGFESSIRPDGNGSIIVEYSHLLYERPKTIYKMSGRRFKEVPSELTTA